jgi:hypothetical protein
MAANAVRIGARRRGVSGFSDGAEQDEISARQDLQNGPNAKDVVCAPAQ